MFGTLVLLRNGIARSHDKRIHKLAKANTMHISNARVPRHEGWLGENAPRSILDLQAKLAPKQIGKTPGKAYRFCPVYNTHTRASPTKLMIQ